MAVPGLPPRGRGRVGDVPAGAVGGRITPAWAGKRCGVLTRDGAAGDYPRVGGEETTFREVLGSLWGLPPRGRGRGPTFAHLGEQAGITPAWAGKSDKL